MKCPKCGNTSKFKEIISEGMKQELIYEEGYVITETTTYQKDKGELFCMKCNHKIKGAYRL